MSWVSGFRGNKKGKKKEGLIVFFSLYTCTHSDIISEEHQNIVNYDLILVVLVYLLDFYRNRPA